jgi:hypothetical protein
MLRCRRMQSSSRMLKKARVSLPVETKARLYVSDSHARN